MKHIAFLCGAIAVSGCAGQSEYSTRSAELPGIQTTINCNPEPLRVFSKTGDLIEISSPVLHPSCSGDAKAVPAVKQPSQNLLAGILNGMNFGPATVRTKTLEADGNDPLPVVIASRNETDNGAAPSDAPISDDSTETTESPRSEEAAGDGQIGSTESTSKPDVGAAGIAPVRETEEKTEEPAQQEPKHSKSDKLNVCTGNR